MPTPKDMPVRKPAGKPKFQPTATPSRNGNEQAWDDGYKQGMIDGKKSVKNMVLTFLQKEYSKPSVERGSQLGHDILELTGKLSKLLK